MKAKRKKIGRKVTELLLITVAITVVLIGGISIVSLSAMKKTSVESNIELGQTAAMDSSQALENMGTAQLQIIAVEKAAYIEEKFEAIEAYVLGIAELAEEVYAYPEKYPDREIALPKENSTELAVQLLASEKLMTPTKEQKQEINKLGNIQELLVQYNAHNHMVSATYLATKSGWMIQADYIAFSKYDRESHTIMPYEAEERQWYQKAQNAQQGEVVYTDIMKDVHNGGECIVCASPVYYKGEVVAVAGVGSYLETVKNAVLNTTIGEGGYAFLVNEKGQIIVSPMSDGEVAANSDVNSDLRKGKNRELAEVADEMVLGKKGITRITLDDVEVYMAYAPLEKLGWSFAAVISVDEVLEPANMSQQTILELTQNVAKKQDATIQSVLLTLMIGVMCTALLVGCFGMLFSEKITRPIRKLTQEVKNIDAGNLDFRIHINTGDEVENLGQAFNDMATQIQTYISNLDTVTTEKEKIRMEIEVASKLQADMLPEVEGVYADREEFQLYATMNPAKGVGGDFYDFFLLDEDHLALIMADVSGKGVSAALFMVASRTLIRSHMSLHMPLAQIVECINSSLCQNNKNGMFVTAWLGILTLSTGKLCYVNAGHCHPFVQHMDGRGYFERKKGGFVLAGMEELTYVQHEVRLRQNDTLLLYTDGVTEATSINNTLYGEERLKKCVESAGKRTPKELLDVVWKDVEKFQKGAEQFDDITMLAITWYGGNYKEKTEKAKIENLGIFATFLEEELSAQGISDKTAIKLQMTVDEIYSNICYYSGADDVTMRVSVEKDNVSGKNMVQIIFLDDGVPYNPLEKPDPDVDELLEQRSQGGLGIYLVKKRMDKVEYIYEDGRNCLIVMKRDD